MLLTVITMNQNIITVHAVGENVLVFPKPITANRMTMRTETVGRLERQFVNDVENIYNNAARFGWADSFIIEALKKNIYENPDFKRIPRYAQSFVFGAIHLLRQQHWKLVAYSYEIDGTRYLICEEAYRKFSPREVHEKWSHTGCFVYRNDKTKFFTFPESEQDK